jgi:hypothetical protein
MTNILTEILSLAIAKEGKTNHFVTDDGKLQHCKQLEQVNEQEPKLNCEKMRMEMIKNKNRGGFRGY